MSGMLQILGAALAQATGTQEATCRGLLRLTITDSVVELSTATPQQILSHINTMSYDGWKMTLEHPELSRRLTAIGVKDAGSVVSELKQTLVEKQSLLMMTVQP